MNKIKLGLWLMACSLSIVAKAQKIAFVNEAKVLEVLPGYQTAIKTVDSIKMVFTNEINESKRELKGKADALMGSYNLPTDASYQMLLSQLTPADSIKFLMLIEEDQFLQRLAKSKELEYQMIYQEKVGKLLDQLNLQIETYCKTNKIDALYKLDQVQASLVYYDRSKDITEEVIKLILKTKPNK